MEKNRALDDLKTIREVMERTARLLNSSAPILIMWGFIIMIGYGLAPLMKEKTGLFWIIAGPLGGILSAVIGIRQDIKFGRVESWVGKRLAVFWLSWFAISYLLFFNVVYSDTKPFFIESGFYWALIASIGFITTGLLVGMEFVSAGIIIALSAVVGFYSFPQYFHYIVGLVSGGTILLLGIKELKKK